MGVPACPVPVKRSRSTIELKANVSAVSITMIKSMSIYYRIESVTYVVLPDFTTSSPSIYYRIESLIRLHASEENLCEVDLL